MDHENNNGAIDFDFFRSLARELLGDIRLALVSGTAPTKEVEAKVAKAFRDSFESGLSSSLVGVVSAIEAVRVPPNGMVLFRIPPSMPEMATEALRRDMRHIATELRARLGRAPIILVVPDGVDAQVVEFEEEAGEETDKAAPSAATHAVERQLHAFDANALRDLVIDALPDPDLGTVSVLPLASSVETHPTGARMAKHTVRILVPRGSYEDPEAQVNIREAAQEYADKLGATLVVSVAVDGAVPFRTEDYTLTPSPRR
jgi:hypothetical protein